LIRFDASSSSDPEGPIARYSWDLEDDGTFESNGDDPFMTPSLYYLDIGSHVAHVRVDDFQGASATTTRTINVIENHAPTASFTITPNPARTGQTVTFDGSSSSDPDGHDLRYTWDLDNDGFGDEFTHEEPTITHTYFSAGTKLVRLRVRDPVDASGDAEQEFYVAPASSASAAALPLGSPFAIPAARRARELAFSARLNARRTRGGRLRGRATFRFALERDGTATVLGRLRVQSGAKRPLPPACRRLETVG
jgi:hypothetical protein